MILAAALVVAVVATGWVVSSMDKSDGQSAQDQQAGTDEGAVDSQSAVDYEGSVLTADGMFVRYPDGVVVTFASVEKLASNLAETKPGQTLVKVSFTIRNEGNASVPLDGNYRSLTLLYGEDRYQADQNPGYTESADVLTSKIPEQISPGSIVPLFYTFDVPSSGMAAIAVRLDLRPGVYTTYVFTDVEKRL